MPLTRDWMLKVMCQFLSGQNYLLNILKSTNLILNFPLWIRALIVNMKSCCKVFILEGLKKQGAEGGIIKVQTKTVKKSLRNCFRVCMLFSPNLYTSYRLENLRTFSASPAL